MYPPNEVSRHRDNVDVLQRKKKERKCKTPHVVARRIHGKNDFAEILKNLDRYKSKNNFVGP